MSGVEDAHDQQETADSGDLDLPLAGSVAGPVVLERDREEDERAEDEVVRDIGEHEVALAGPRVGAEDVGCVGAAESFDERSERHRDGEEREVGE